MIRTQKKTGGQNKIQRNRHGKDAREVDIIQLRVFSHPAERKRRSKSIALAPLCQMLMTKLTVMISEFICFPIRLGEDREKKVFGY